MGKQSYDRVRFFLSEHRVNSDRAKFSDLLSYAFDLEITQFMTRSGYLRLSGLTLMGVMIECRPSQFARFLIKRNELGLNNGFKELFPRLYVPEAQEHTPFIDVSKRTHKCPDMGQGHYFQDEEEVRIC
jgi:hypothetical protein